MVESGSERGKRPTFAAENKEQKRMNDERPRKPLTRAETEVMNILWDSPQALTVREIVERYLEPLPAVTTVGTFLRILEAKGYVVHRRKAVSTGRTFVYMPTMTREKYLAIVMGEVRDSLFSRSAKKLCSYFIEHEDLSDEDLMEIMALIEQQKEHL